MLKQLVLVTDGCSNVGMYPAAAAAHAKTQQITVHVVGVVDEGEFGSRGEQEVAEIAEAGGGMYRIIPTQQLSGTIQMMTRMTVAQTVQQAVQTELKQVLGNHSLEDLPPAQRGDVVQVVERVSENIDLRAALLIDTSASMRPKLRQVEEAILDLSISLQSRQGKSEVSVFHFPGNGKPFREIELALGWTEQVPAVRQLFSKLNMKGATPTGPAIMKVVEYFEKGYLQEELRQSSPSVKDWRDEDGILRDYII